ncbi:helix-turn-helix domain-containing protein [Catenulispora pinisilvae]|uniref:helix-turn-helix domain-containing protein n=1 Tax=Catenulispora pinisilvae TaxID=2705253 RepID=UPI0018917935|nr:helix-turn-helix transcriptional regulator [Catenulispora pinisilvae]
MTLRVDPAAERTFAQMISCLRLARLDAGLSQTELSSGLPVRGRAISEWETGAIEPTLDHLIQWSHELRRRLVVVGRDGESIKDPTRQRPGESWVVFERRRLATPLKNRRVALGQSQDGLGQLVGVSRDSVSRWELVRVPVRPMGLVVWAQKLGCSIAVQPTEISGARALGRSLVR